MTPAEPFSTGLWIEAAARALSPTPAATSTAQPQTPFIVVGGTGLYIKALTDGIQSTVAQPDVRAKWQTVFERDGIDGLQTALQQLAPGSLENLADRANPRRVLRALEQVETNGTLPDQWKKDDNATAPFIVLTLPREQLHRRIALRVDQMFRAGFIEEVRALRRDYPSWSSTAAKAIGYEEVSALLDNTLTQEQAREKIIIRTRQLAKRQETWFRHQARAQWLLLTETDTPQAIAERVRNLWRDHGPTTIRVPGC